jgi:hypothetical protein
MKIFGRQDHLRALSLVALLTSSSGWSDQYHYSNILLGDRAQGLGGAFAGVSDDASGVVYNPAGIAFALSNDISGSANVFSVKKVTYDTKKYFEKNFSEKSQSYFSPFVGGLGKLDAVSEGLVFAVAIQVSDAELRDQNDLIEMDSFQSATNFVYHRTLNMRASTNRYGAAIAKRFGSSFSLGAGLNFVAVEELTQAFQYSSLDLVDTAGVPVRLTNIQNVRELYKLQALEASIGTQWVVGGWISLGLMLRMPSTLSATLEQNVQSTSIQKKYNGSAWVGESTSAVINDPPVKDPLKGVPTEARFGTAFFFTPSYLMTLDVSNYGATKSNYSSVYNRKAVTNFAMGHELYVTPSIPLRFGLFTNKDARSKPTSDLRTSEESIDYTGGSLFIGYTQPNSQLSGGVVYQTGSKGRSRKINTIVVDAKGELLALGFSIGHNF